MRMNHGSWRSRNLDASRDYLRGRSLRRKYGLTIQQWDERFRAQGSCCAICKATEPGTSRGWCTDHDHETGEVRGILCHRCNRLLGMLGDNSAGVESNTAAIRVYLGSPLLDGVGEGLLS